MFDGIFAIGDKWGAGRLKQMNCRNAFLGRRCLVAGRLALYKYASAAAGPVRYGFIAFLCGVGFIACWPHGILQAKPSQGTDS